MTPSATASSPSNVNDERTLAANMPVRFNEAALLDADRDPDVYGRALTKQVFADRAMRDAWIEARSLAEGANTGLRLRLCLGEDEDLHLLRWETYARPPVCSRQCLSLWPRGWAS